MSSVQTSFPICACPHHSQVFLPTNSYSNPMPSAPLYSDVANLLDYELEPVQYAMKSNTLITKIVNFSKQHFAKTKNIVIQTMIGFILFTKLRDGLVCSRLCHQKLLSWNTLTMVSLLIGSYKIAGFAMKLIK